MNDDDTIFELFLQSVVSRIERLVTSALRNGRSLGEICIVMERRADGQISGGSAPREAIVRRWLSDPNIPEQTKTEMAAKVLETPANEVPVVFAITRDGRITFAIRRFEGDVLKPEKPS